MVQELVVTLREGGETSLMLALLFSALKSARHSAYRAAAWVGFILALALSVGAGFVLRDLGSLGPLFEASLAWLGAGFVASLALQLHGSTASYRSRLPLLSESAASGRVSWPALFAIGAFAFVSVIREGLETAVFLSSSSSFASEGAWMGAAAGLSLAAAFGIAIYFGFRRLNVRAFMRTTEILLFALVVSLLVTGAAEFAEAGFLEVPGVLLLAHDTWVRTGGFLQLLLVAAPFLYVWLARAPARGWLRAAGIAVALAVTPQLLGFAARQTEHARMAAGERDEARRVERSVRARTDAMLEALADLTANVRAGRVAEARADWIAARSRFVQVEPYLAQANPEAAEELNGEPGEAAGFHGIEEQLFEAGAPWAADPDRRGSLSGAISGLRARARTAVAPLGVAPLPPARVRAAWADLRWTFLGRLDGQESAASQTSILELEATLDAMDADQGGHGGATAPLRAALAGALKEASRGPRYGEAVPETVVSATALLRPVSLRGPDRAWDLVDRAAARRAAERAFDAIAKSAAPGALSGAL